MTSTEQQQPGEQQRDADGESTASREARYRVERNEARAERDALNEQVEGLRKQIVEGMIGDLNAKAFWAGAGVEGVADLLGDDGSVDAEKVTQAVGTAREAFGIPEGPRPPKAAPTQGQFADGQARSVDDDFVAALRGGGED